MHQPGEVKSELLAIVVFNEVEWLHVLDEALTDNHATGEPPAILKPRGVDHVTLGHVDRPVVKNDSAFLQVFDIHFLRKCCQNNGLDLASVELIKHVTSIALERQHAVILRKTAFDAEDLAHQVDYRVIEVKDDHHGVVCARCLIEVILRIDLVVYGVVDTTAGHERMQLTEKHVDGVSPRHNAIVW